MAGVMLAIWAAGRPAPVQKQPELSTRDNR
jgi:hypothetical protein